MKKIILAGLMIAFAGIALANSNPVMTQAVNQSSLSVAYEVPGMSAVINHPQLMWNDVKKYCINKNPCQVFIVGQSYAGSNQLGVISINGLTEEFLSFSNNDPANVSSSGNVITVAASASDKK